MVPRLHVVNAGERKMSDASERDCKEGLLIYRDGVFYVRSVLEMLTVILGSGKVSYSSSS